MKAPTFPGVLRTITVKKDVTDLQGWKIRKGLVIHVMKEGPVPPKGSKFRKILVVRVDNGFEDLKMFPETAVYADDVEGGQP